MILRALKKLFLYVSLFSLGFIIFINLNILGYTLEFFRKAVRVNYRGNLLSLHCVCKIKKLVKKKNKIFVLTVFI